MPVEELRPFLARSLADPGTGWSMGAPGVVAEFVRGADEPVLGGAGRVVTARGGIRLTLPQSLRAVAYETPAGPHEFWNQTVALCLPALEARLSGRSVVTELGPDTASLRPADRSTPVFDLGLGVRTVEACVRTADPELVAALRAAEGRPLLEDPALVGALVAAGPHRVFVTALGRIEVYTPIPASDGRSPDGPHTHLLPDLLRAGRTHAATVPVPAGYLPCASLYPPHPLTDVAAGDGPLVIGTDAPCHRQSGRSVPPRPEIGPDADDRQDGFR